MSANPGGADVNQTVTLTAKFTDPDSRITRYAWDLDGNGTIERSTDVPTTQTSYGGAGTYAPKVFANDFRGGTGSASTTIRVAALPVPPPPSPPPATSTRPSIRLATSGSKGRATFRVTCDSACAGRASLTVSRATAKRLGIARRTVGTSRVLLAAAGTRQFSIRLSSTALRQMRRNGLTRVTVRLRASVTDRESQLRIVARTLRIRRAPER